MTSAADKKKTIKEIYRNSSERISLALKLFGQPKQDEPLVFQSERDFETISSLLGNAVQSQHQEEANDYRLAILDVGQWLVGAYTREYLSTYKNQQPNVLYVVKRGLEVLHLMLHRDLRRRQLSPTESQVFHEFKKLISGLPRPSQNTASSVENNLGRKSS
ncbi:MAG: hypothetical protein FJY29_06075 [Betaproteobacteria bacterium]|nr:hypothetical protein [Betaproteobacteria bacterium]